MEIKIRSQKIFIDDLMIGLGFGLCFSKLFWIGVLIIFVTIMVSAIKGVVDRRNKK